MMILQDVQDTFAISDGLECLLRVFAFCSRQLVFPWNIEWWPLIWRVGGAVAGSTACVYIRIG